MIIMLVVSVGLNIFATAEVRKTERDFADEKVLALTLLARTVSNVKGAILLLDAKRIVEARIVTRAALENLYWIVGLAEEGEVFVRKMRDDEMSHRLWQGQNFFEADIALEKDVSERLRTFLRGAHRRFENAKSLSPKQVAQIRNDFEKTYIFYGQLSSDAAHPLVTALNRYVIPEILFIPLGNFRTSGSWSSTAETDNQYGHRHPQNQNAFGSDQHNLRSE